MRTMQKHQIQILRIFSSITVRIGGFLLTTPLVMFLGGKLLDPSNKGHAFFSQQEATLFLLSILLGLLVAVVVGVKCYRYIGKSK